ncbi:MAG: hypothetical protein IT243_10870, partial [Bacteroidia bacterium]|nr:hypothetical protein [Bacteroidia bacterium]
MKNFLLNLESNIKTNLFIVIIIFFGFSDIVYSQSNVGIGTNSPSADAILDLVSKNQGFLTPRVTTAERLSIPATSNGLLVFDINLGLFFYWNSTSSVWQALDDNSSTNELLQGITYDSITNILTVWDNGNTFNINLKKNYYNQKITVSNDTIFLNGGGFVKIPTSADNQNLSIIGGRLTIQRGNTISIPDSSATNEIQSISISGGKGKIYLTNGGNVVLNDSSSTNEIQTLSKSGNVLTLSNGGGSVTVTDQDSTNEIQTISKTGVNVTLSKGGGTINVNDADSNSTNEIQSISISGGKGKIYLINGGNVVLNDSSSTNEIQTLSKSGNVLTLSNGGGSVTVTDQDSTN